MFSMDKIIYRIITFLFVTFITSAVFAGNNHTFTEIKDINSLQIVFQEFADEEFNKYLQEVKGIDLSEHQTVIQTLLIEYQKAFSTIDACFSEYSNLEKKYSNTWIKDIEKKFGKKYLKENSESIKNLIMNINLKHYSTYCIDNEKDGLYSEVQYILEAKDFFQSYIRFFDSQTQKGKKLKPEKRMRAEKIINDLSDFPIQRMLCGGRTRISLGLKYKVKLKKEVFEFMVNHPEFKKPFKLIQAVEGFLKFVSDSNQTR